MSNSPARFDRVAWVYDAMAGVVFGKSIFASQSHFLDRIPDDANVLILGGGTGKILKRLFSIKPRCHVWYIEASSQMISRARRNVHKPSDILFVHGTEDAIPNAVQFD